MSRAAVGERAGAVLDAVDGRVRLIGYGVRQPDSVPAADAGGFGPHLHEAEVVNPEILLDSGERVWGCECWWASEQQISAMVEARKAEGWEVVQVSPADWRAATE